MSTRSRVFFFAVAGLLFAASATAAPLPELKRGDALIENTGSTNTTGYSIYVSPTGAVLYAKVGGTRVTPVHFDVASLPKSQAKSLFHDIAAAGPLAALPARHGMRSASFGTATFITYKGQRSPDLTFPANAQAQALRADITAITQTLHLANNPRRPISRPALP